MRYSITLFCALALNIGQMVSAQTVEMEKGLSTAYKNDITIVQPPGFNLDTLKEIAAGVNLVNPTPVGEAAKAAFTVAMGLLWDPIGKAITNTELCASARNALKNPQAGGQHLFSYTVNIQGSFGGSTVGSYKQTYMAFVADGQIYYVPIVKLGDDQFIYGKPQPCTKFRDDPDLKQWKTATQATPFDTPYGKITVYLPGDMRAGDIISGTVSVEPAGAADAARASNMASLSGFVIDTGERRTPLNEGRLLLTIGAEGGLIPIILRDSGGARVAMSGSNALPPAAPVVSLPPVGPVSPVAQPLSIPGNFDGNAGNTRATINGQPTNIIAESPRQAVVNCPPGTMGMVKITVTDPKGVASASTNLVGIRLSAPKTNLLRGERTVVSVEIMGLQGLREPLLVNLSASSTVKLQGGNNQTLRIDPAKADASGVVRRELSLQSKAPGPFDVTGDLLPPKN